jgi:hypothetical protein
MRNLSWTAVSLRWHDKRYEPTPGSPQLELQMTGFRFISLHSLIENIGAPEFIGEAFLTCTPVIMTFLVP